VAARIVEALRHARSDELWCKVLARRLGIAPRTLQRAFKRCSWITPSQLLRHLRVHLAMVARDANFQAGDIATALGYSNASSLARAMRWPEAGRQDGLDRTARASARVSRLVP
jgi:transcriptional regulator GlxA family with amidase domain